MAFAPEEYSLIDFGEGRRLERFGPLVLDRPCPAADQAPRSATAARWAAADARFGGRSPNGGAWSERPGLPERWTVRHGAIRFELKRTGFGHLGIFPEQAVNWDWIAGQLRATGSVLRVLNLFAYTGGCTMAAARAGAEVVHVDAARNAVAWARRNAELSGLAEARIRWIADDAAKFVRRELKRDHGYDAVILDPPSYGHGARGEVWRLSKHLPLLLKDCARLAAGRCRFVLLTCHTPKYGPATLKSLLKEAMAGGSPGQVAAAALAIRAADGREMPSGAVARWTAC